MSYSVVVLIDYCNRYYHCGPVTVRHRQVVAHGGPEVVVQPGPGRPGPGLRLLGHPDDGAVGPEEAKGALQYQGIVVIFSSPEIIY